MLGRHGVVKRQQTRDDVCDVKDGQLYCRLHRTSVLHIAHCNTVCDSIHVSTRSVEGIIIICYGLLRDGTNLLRYGSALL